MLSLPALLQRHIFRLPVAVSFKRCLVSSSVALPVTSNSTSLPMRTLMRHQHYSKILPVSSYAVECTGVAAVDTQLESNRHHHHHHRQQRQRCANDTNATLATVPMLGVGLLLCSNTTQGDGNDFAFSHTYAHTLTHTHTHTHSLTQMRAVGGSQ